MLGIVSLTLILCITSGTAYSRRCAKIVEGVNAADGEFPFLVSLRDDLNRHICGGAIICPKYILTAAHCCQNEKVKTIQYGQTKISQHSENTIKIVKTIQHKEFYLNNAKNDIALLELGENLKFSQYVGKIKLPKLNEEYPDEQKVTIMGWGATSPFFRDSKSVGHLQKVQVLIINYVECKKRLPNGQFCVTSTNICTAVPGGWKGPCFGDSGGPLVLNDKIIGIVSFGSYPCTAPPKPSVYTKVSSYVTWITETAGLK